MSSLLETHEDIFCRVVAHFLFHYFFLHIHLINDVVVIIISIFIICIHIRGAFKNYAGKHSTSFILATRFIVYTTRKIDYCQLFMHATIDFYASIAKLRLLR